MDSMLFNARNVYLLVSYVHFIVHISIMDAILVFLRANVFKI